MSRSHKKKCLSTTIDTDLLKQFRILALQEDKRLNQLLEEGIRDVLAKYERNFSLPVKSLATAQEEMEREKSDSNSVSLQGVEATLQEMVTEVQNTRRAIESRPKKLSPVIPALTGLVIGLVLSGAFFTAKYSDLVRHKFGSDARAIKLTRIEDHSAETAEGGLPQNSIIEQKDESHEFEPVRIDGQEQFVGMPPQSTMIVGGASKFRSLDRILRTTQTRSVGILATGVENHSRAAAEIPSLTELSDFRLNVFAWVQNRDQRLVVVDDRVLHEGDEVGGARVLRIRPDHVVFSRQNEVFIKKINSEPSGHGQR